jgi:hypothetical protein
MIANIRPSSPSSTLNTVITVTASRDSEEYYRLVNTQRVVQDELNFLFKELQTLLNRKVSTWDDEEEIEALRNEITDAKEEMYEIKQALKAFI